jgi:hypothetical protein
VGIHPSLPNYIWSEAGSNLGVTNDNPPFGPGGNNQTSANLSGLLQSQGTSWKSYSWPRERNYDEKRAGRLGRARVRLCTAFAGIEEIANIRHVGDDLVDIVYGGSVLFQ